MRRGLAAAVAAFVCGAGVAACAVGAVDLEPAVLESLEGGPHSGVADRSFRVVGDERTFHTLYASVHAHRMPAPRPPVVDFDTHAVLAAFLGARSTGGHRTGFGAVVVEGGVARVALVERGPPPVAVLTQVMTTPYAIAMLARQNIRVVEFVDGAGVVVFRGLLP